MTSSVSLAVMFLGEMSTTGGSAIRRGENQSTLSNLEEKVEEEED